MATSIKFDTEKDIFMKAFLIFIAVVIVSVQTYAKPIIHFSLIGDGVNNGSSFTYDDVLELKGSCSGFGDKSDNLIFGSAAIPSLTFDVSAVSTYLYGTANVAETGLMIRNDNAVNSAFLSITQISEKCLVIRYRSKDNGPLKTIELSRTMYNHFRITANNGI